MVLKWTKEMCGYLRDHHSELSIRELADALSSISRAKGGKVVNEAAVHHRMRAMGLRGTMKAPVNYEGYRRS